MMLSDNSKNDRVFHKIMWDTLIFMQKWKAVRQLVKKRKRSVEPSLKEHSLKYERKYYKVDEGRAAITEDKVSDENARLLTMVAIAEELKTEEVRKAEIILAVYKKKYWMNTLSLFLKSKNVLDKGYSLCLIR